MRFFGGSLLSLLTVACTFAQTPAIFPGGVVNGVTYAPGVPVAPGSIASIFGSDLAATLAQADSVPLSTNLANVSVTMNGIPAPLFFVGPGQVNVQVPFNVLPDGANTGLATVIVRQGQLASNVQSVQIASLSPAIFTTASNAVGNAIAVNPDGTLAAPSGSIPGLISRPANAGDPLVILATGLGAVTPAVANGANSIDQLRTTVNTPTVLIGGQPAQLLFSGLSPSFTGVYQINTVIPAGLTGPVVSLQLQIGGLITSDQVTIAIQ